jgi:hypothetical protein
MYPYQPFMNAHPSSNGDPITDTSTPTEALLLPTLLSLLLYHSLIHIILCILHMNRTKLLLHMVILLYFILLQP